MADVNDAYLEGRIAYRRWERLSKLRDAAMLAILIWDHYPPAQALALAVYEKLAAAEVLAGRKVYETTRARRQEEP